MKARDCGLDILRCMAMFFVTGLHSFMYNGFYDTYQIGEFMWLADCIRWACYACIGIFLMLTGYLKSQKPLNRNYFKSLIPVLVGYVLTCLIAFPIRHFFQDEQLSLREWIDKLLTFGNYAWYVEMYIGLLLISPVINLALAQLTSRSELLWAAVIAFSITALPSVTQKNWIPDYWVELYPFTYYVLGAVIRRLQPRIGFWKGILSICLWIGFMGYLSISSTNDIFDTGFWQNHGGFWVTVMVVLIFLTFYRVQLKERLAKLVAWAAGGTFEGYLLSRLFDVWVYGKVEQWHEPRYYLLILLFVTIPVFLASVIMGKGVHTLAGWICRPLYQSNRIAEKV